MITYGNDSIQVNEALPEYQTIGEVTVKRFGKYLPMISLQLSDFNKDPLSNNNTEVCDGDCLKHF